jgi:acetyltransferase-like isoleucine patch superfamily enzyme
MKRFRLWRRYRRRSARALLRARHGLVVPSDSFVEAPRQITNGQLVRIGRGVLIRAGSRLEVVPVDPRDSRASGSLVLGDGTQLEDMVTISAAAELRIGRHCLVASFVTITDNDHSRGVLPSAAILDQPQSVEPTTIGESVWIGTGAVILKGVTVGDGATVGANAVVTHDVAPGATVAGVPARPIQNRR